MANIGRFFFGSGLMLRWAAALAVLWIALYGAGCGGGASPAPVSAGPVLTITSASPVAVDGPIKVSSDKALISISAVSLATPENVVLPANSVLSADQLSISITPVSPLPFATVITVTVKATASGVSGSVTGQLTTAAAVASDAPLIDVHFAVLSTRPEALARATEAQMRREVDILNTYFKGADGSKPVSFRFKDVVYAHQLPATVCASLVELGDLKKEYDYTRLMTRYTACKDSRLADPQAINVYVYDSYSVADGYDNIDSHGIHNSGHPLVLLDWERLNHTTASPEEHEFGHVFGLGHVCVPGATANTSTNIMTSYDCGTGSNGLRDIGFDANQLSTIKQHAKIIVAAFQ